MDKDRVEGSAKEIKGKTKEVAGKVLGDAKLESGQGGRKDPECCRRRQRHAQGEVTAAARFPCFALLSTCAENGASNLLRTEIDGESSATSRAFECEGI